MLNKCALNWERNIDNNNKISGGKNEGGKKEKKKKKSFSCRIRLMVTSLCVKLVLKAGCNFGNFMKDQCRHLPWCPVLCNTN